MVNSPKKASFCGSDEKPLEEQGFDCGGKGESKEHRGRQITTATHMLQAQKKDGRHSSRGKTVCEPRQPRNNVSLLLGRQGRHLCAQQPHKKKSGWTAKGTSRAAQEYTEQRHKATLHMYESRAQSTGERSLWESDGAYLGLWPRANEKDEAGGGRLLSAGPKNLVATHNRAK